jgi:type I restriction enzyme, R subunit
MHLIDWEHPERNDCALAEEVTLNGGYERRPDVVLYLNGIAVAVIELKRSSVEIADGVRQLITNQEEIFNLPFFATAQLLLAGSDSQGLRYGTVTTREEFFVDLKAPPLPDGAAVPAGAHLDRPLAGLCSRARLLDLMRNMVVFDNGVKKVPCHHQFAGVKAAQERIRRREGGVIWHTQGSGKSILMVLFAKWLLEHDPAARILIVTDRDELDKLDVDEGDGGDNNMELKDWLEEGRKQLDAAHEDEVGELQSPRRPHSPHHGAGEKAEGPA